MTAFAKIIDFPEENTQIIMKKSTENEGEEFYYTIVIESYKSFEDFLAEPKATFKYTSESKRDSVFNLKKIEKQAKKVIKAALTEIKQIIHKQN